MIGSHSVERLVADGHEVHALAGNEAGAELLESIGARVVPGSVEDPTVWESLEGTDLILHAAAVLPRRATWSEFESVNVGATRLMIGAAKRLGARIIHISSVAVYGRTGIRPITEEPLLASSTRWIFTLARSGWLKKFSGMRLPGMT